MVLVRWPGRLCQGSKVRPPSERQTHGEPSELPQHLAPRSAMLALVNHFAQFLCTVIHPPSVPTRPQMIPGDNQID
jgi:hypothetical protein